MPFSRRLKDLSVMIGTPSTSGDFNVRTLISYLDTQATCNKYGIPLDIEFVTGSLVHHARTKLANHFLQSKHNILFQIDSDIKWTPMDFVKVLGHMLKHDCVVGVYPRRQDPLAYFMKAIPGAEPNEDGLVPILGTGLGFACVRRGVIEHLAALSPKLRFAGAQEPVPAIFRCDDDGEEARGEDYAFWADVIEAGYQVYADATITLGHVGTKVYQSDLSQSHALKENSNGTSC